MTLQLLLWLVSPHKPFQLNNPRISPEEPEVPGCSIFIKALFIPHKEITKDTDYQSFIYQMSKDDLVGPDNNDQKTFDKYFLFNNYVVVEPSKESNLSSLNLYCCSMEENKYLIKNYEENVLKILESLDMITIFFSILKNKLFTDFLDKIHHQGCHVMINEEVMFKEFCDPDKKKTIFAVVTKLHLYKYNFRRIYFELCRDICIQKRQRNINVVGNEVFYNISPKIYKLLLKIKMFENSLLMLIVWIQSVVQEYFIREDSSFLIHLSSYSFEDYVRCKSENTMIVNCINDDMTYIDSCVQIISREFIVFNTKAVYLNEVRNIVNQLLLKIIRISLDDFTSKYDWARRFTSSATEHNFFPEGVSLPYNIPNSQVHFNIIY